MAYKERQQSICVLTNKRSAGLQIFYACDSPNRPTYGVFLNLLTYLGLLTCAIRHLGDSDISWLGQIYYYIWLGVVTTAPVYNCV